MPVSGIAHKTDEDIVAMLLPGTELDACEV